MDMPQDQEPVHQVNIVTTVAIQLSGTPGELAAFEQRLERLVRDMPGVDRATVLEIEEAGYGVYNTRERDRAIGAFNRCFGRRNHAT